MGFKISDLVEINKRSLSKKDSRTEIKYLDTSNLTEGIIDEIVTYDLKVDKAPSRARRKVKKNDILISTVRPNQKHYGIISEKQVDYIVSTGFAVLSPDVGKVDPYYLYKYLTSENITKKLHSIAEDSTSAYPSIRPNVIGDLNIELPNLQIQRSVGSFFRNIDSKILLNKDVIFTLEQLAQTLFKHWFVDFEFPDENGEPYKSSGGEMVESELGKIPKGWHIGTAGELFEFSPKERLKKGEIYPYVEMKNLSSSAMIYEWIDREFKGSGSRFRNGDTLLARITPCLENGKIGFVDFLVDNVVGWGSTEFIVIRSKTGIEKSFSYYFTSESSFKEYAVANMNGSSGRQRVKAETLAEYKTVIPTLKIIGKYTDITNLGMAFMANLRDQNKSLQNLGDTLLPRLLSGEIELPENGEVSL